MSDEIYKGWELAGHIYDTKSHLFHFYEVVVQKSFADPLNPEKTWLWKREVLTRVVAPDRDVALDEARKRVDKHEDRGAGGMTDQEREDRELARLQAEIDWLFDAPVSRPVTSLSTARNAGRARTGDYWHGHKYYINVVRPRMIADRIFRDVRKKRQEAA